MELFPAIDIQNGRVVRLTQGDFARLKIYDNSPAAVARQFREQGAKNLHVVDLDGAKNGSQTNVEAIGEILKVEGLSVQVGGGIRSMAAVEAYLQLGIDRVILGTAAAERFSFVEESVALYGDQIAVGVDARNGTVAVRGWQQDSGLNSFDFCKKLEQAGVSTIIYTDISRDGMMAGLDYDVYARLNAHVTCDIIASGGVSSWEDVQALAKLELYGAIVGKALYEGTMDLKELLLLC